MLLDRWVIFFFFLERLNTVFPRSLGKHLQMKLKELDFHHRRLERGGVVVAFIWHTRIDFDEFLKQMFEKWVVEIESNPLLVQYGQQD